MKERSRAEKIVDKIEKAQEASSQAEGAPAFAEAFSSPEEGAEQLYAFWRDYNRSKFGAYRALIKGEGGRESTMRLDKAEREKLAVTVDGNPKLAVLGAEIRARFQNEQVREYFEEVLEREFAAEEQLAPSEQNYARERKLKETAEARLLELYSNIFSHREKEPDELTLCELVVLKTRINASSNSMRRMERGDARLAAKLKFEQIRKYREQLIKGGFIWTPSREKLFYKCLEHLVIANQNRPLLLYGETGVGKTCFARAVAMRLTGLAPYEVGEEAKSDIRPILGRLLMDKEGPYVVYGPLGQAVTGKRTSRDATGGDGGIFYMDEMNGYPPDGLRALIKQLSGRSAGKNVSFVAWAGQAEKIAPKFGFIGSANLPSEKHPDRAEFPVEVAREIASLEIDYPPQTNENPELYEMMLAALMDRNDRIRCDRRELPPAWKEVVDAETKTKRFEIDTDPNAGGTLWRFARFVHEIQESYKGNTNALTSASGDASYLRSAVLDPGIVLSWLQEYRKSAARSKESMVDFLTEKINGWGAQKTYPEEDRKLIKEFQERFNLSSR